MINVKKGSKLSPFSRKITPYSTNWSMGHIHIAGRQMFLIYTPFFILNPIIEHIYAPLSPAS